jgi:AraC-like DNA-binding protein
MQDQISKISEYIEKNLQQEFSLRDISDFFGYSPYHFSREYRKATGRSIMDVVRERKIHAAAQEIAAGKSILEMALVYGFDTHASFTRAFADEMGCTPKEYLRHHQKLSYKGEYSMDTSKIKVRLVCKDDVNDLWENVYSAMTPRQILEDKVLPSIDNYKNQKGFMAVAEVEGKAVMTLWVERLYSGPGFIYDSHYTWQNSEFDCVFQNLLEGAVRFARQLYMTTLCIYEEENSSYIEGFLKGGFKKVFSAAGTEYFMLSI